MNEKTHKTGTPADDMPLGLAAMPFPLAVWAYTLPVWTTLGARAAQLVCDGLAKDMNAQRAIMNCGSLEELIQFQIDYFTAAAYDYNDEICKMQQLANDLIVGGMSTSDEAIEFEDVPV